MGDQPSSWEATWGFWSRSQGDPGPWRCTASGEREYFRGILSSEYTEYSDCNVVFVAERIHIDEVLRGPCEDLEFQLVDAH